MIESIDLSTPHGHRNKAMIEVMYGCGLRVSELITLQISNIYSEDGFLRLIGKGDKERLVPIGDSSLSILFQYIEGTRRHVNVKWAIPKSVRFPPKPLSVIIQTVYFRKTGGKRIFLMSPIHHHFELKGYKEPKIVTTFSQVSILLCVLTLLLFFYSFGGKL